MSVRPKVASIAEYLAPLSSRQAYVLKRLFALIKRSVPGCKLELSYDMPAFKLDRAFLYCAAFKSHVGIYPPVRGDARLIAALRPYANAKGNLRFPLSEPIPYPLIARVAKALARGG